MRDVRRSPVGRVGLLEQHVLGERDHDRARPSARRDGERTCEELGEPVGRLRLDDPLGQAEPAEGVRVVELLKRVPAEERARRLADEQDHRRRVLRGDVDADARVRRARPAGDEADAGPAGELAVRLGHVRRRRLVAARDQPDVRVVKRVEDREVALPRHAERVLDAVQLQLVDEDLSAGAGHRWPVRCRFRSSGARGASEARTQGALISEDMGATEDAASRRRSRARGP